VKRFPNWWLGVTAENQRTADERIPILLRIPAKVRFVSIEPMLGPVDLTKMNNGCGELYNALTAEVTLRSDKSYKFKTSDTDPLDWVICGGETGPGARPMHPDWVRSLRDQCIAADVPFFFKSWGEWLPQNQNLYELENLRCKDGSHIKVVNDEIVYKVGKKHSGRLLDGIEWNQFPKLEG
jgi:protein gp37